MSLFTQVSLLRITVDTVFVLTADTRHGVLSTVGPVWTAPVAVWTQPGGGGGEREGEEEQRGGERGQEIKNGRKRECMG